MVTHARQKDIDRLVALEYLVQRTRVGSVDAVEIDLRHPDLDVKEWECTSASSLFFFGQLIFPWTKREPLPSRLKRARERFKKYSQLGTSLDDELAWEVAQFSQEVVIEERDTIRIRSVSSAVIGSALDPIEDQEMRNAQLEVLRSSGERVTVPALLEFHRRGAFASAGRKISLEKITSRLCQAFLNEPGYGAPLEHIFSVCLCAWKLVEEATGELAEDEETFLERLLMSCQNVFQNRESLAAMIVGRKTFEFPQVTPIRPLAFDDPELREFHLERAFDEAIAFGYLWGKFETERDVGPLAREGLARKHFSSIGGQRSGRVRQEKAKLSWQTIALAEAKTLRSKNPTWSQDKLTLEISFRHEGLVPGVRTIKAFISKMEKAGEIPVRK